MKKSFMLFISIFIIFSISSQTIAVFDYDDRLDKDDTVAKYIETQLLKWNSSLTVEQFSGKEEEKTSINTLRELDSKGYDLIITVTSDALVIAMNMISNTPTVFTNANNPVIFGIKNIKKPGGNITGATYYVPIEQQFTFYKQIFPQMKKVGLIFNSINKARKAELNESRIVCKKMGLSYEIVLVTSEAQLIAETKKLVNKGIDSIVLSNDGLLYNNVDKLTPITDQAKIPIFSSRNKGVPKGALASLSSDYFKLVDEVVIPYAKRILNGEKAGNIPIGFQKVNDIEINLTKAKQLGITITNSIVNKAIKKY
ncbi:MAG: ABC transporter substrate-binding protein [Spirochaetes bacterium]|nr:ABC transporter substrate-binding protein [Spirochaetota bacterium]